MSDTLTQVTANILKSRDVLLEINGNSIEYAAPEDIQKILNIPEYGILDSSHKIHDHDVIPAAFHSDFFDSLMLLFNDKGRFSITDYPALKMNKTHLEKKLLGYLSFQNAVFNINQTKSIPALYGLLFFRYKAISDEKKEGVLTFLFSKTFHSISVLNDNQMRVIFDQLTNKNDITDEILDDHDLLIAIQSMKPVLFSILNDFTSSLSRRLKRDMDRVSSYYHSLKEELSNKRSNVDKDAELMKDKIKAINSEKNWKLNDLRSKYKMTIQAEPLAIVQIHTMVDSIDLTIKRRLKQRNVAIGYNPMLKQFDFPVCEACFLNIQNETYICDETHIVCEKCYNKCPRCSKLFCKACYCKKCPKCGLL